MFYLWIWLSLVQCPYGIEIHKSGEGAVRSVILFHYLQLYKRGGSSHLIDNKSSHNALWNSPLSSLNQTFSNIQWRAQRGGTSGAGNQRCLKPRKMFSCFSVKCSLICLKDYRPTKCTNEKHSTFKVWNWLRFTFLCTSLFSDSKLIAYWLR